MALPKARQDALSARIGALSFVPGGWAAPARAEALARLGAMGLPGRRDEYWRYTDPSDLVAPEAPRAALFEARDEAPLFDAIDRVRLVFVDGRFDAAASDDPALAGVEIERLSQAGPRDIHWARELFGQLEARGQVPVPRPMAALNTAFAAEGVLIRVTARAARPVALVYRHGSETSDVILHHCIRLDPGAELTLLESGPAGARANLVMEVDVAEGAAFHHIRAQGRDHDCRAATHVFGRLAAAARFKSFTLSANGVLTRNEVLL